MHRERFRLPAAPRNRFRCGRTEALGAAPSGAAWTQVEKAKNLLTPSGQETIVRAVRLFFRQVGA